MCHCGLPLHYASEVVQSVMETLVRERGEFINISVAGRTWAVQRHYVALHGITAAELPSLGFKEIIIVTVTNVGRIYLPHDEWPVVADASWHEGKLEFQAFRRGWMKICRHADGRCVVHGGFISRLQDDPPSLLGGQQCVNDLDIAQAIRQVALTIRAPQACIDQLEHNYARSHSSRSHS